VIGEATPEVTGWLEVTLVETGQLLHSKKNGDGYVDSQDKINKILGAIQAYVASKSK